MSQNERRLGQGISALFGASENTEPAPAKEDPFILIAPDQLVPNPNQPRKNFEDAPLQELAESIRAQGILQPILVRPAKEEGKWQIIAGERRWRAAQLAAVEKIPAIVSDLNDNDAMIAALVENIHREELNPIERASSLAAIKDTLGINNVELANLVGMQRSTVANQLRLLSLPQSIKDDLISGILTMGHARCLINLSPEAAETLRKRIHEAGLTAREAEQAASAWQKENRFPWEKTGHPARERSANPDIIRLADQIGRTLNCKTRINGSPDKGKIYLTYSSNEQLFELLEKLGLSLEAE